MRCSCPWTFSTTCLESVKGVQWYAPEPRAERSPGAPGSGRPRRKPGDAVVHTAMRRFRHCLPCLTLVGAFALTGCTGISIAPSCPNELQVGESAPVLANEINPGEIATYFWEVIPPQLGQVTDPTKPSTMFKATSEGEAVIRLTASDGLYQVISQCQTRVAGTLPPPDDSGEGNVNANTNDNTADNTNDNVDDGKDDNENDNGGRPGGVRKRNPSVP
mgnify:CR=1 FL=1